MIVSGTSQHLQKRALLLAILVAIVGLGAASGMAAWHAASAATPFELVLTAEYEYGSPALGRLITGAFTAKAPFCEAGPVADVDFGVRRFTCADGSGSITLDIGYPHAKFDGAGDWSILEGTGRYAGLRGKGTFWDEVVSDDWTDGPVRTTFQGVVAEDAVAPTIGLASVQTSKVNGKKDVYVISAVLDLRDDVEDNPVSYTVSIRRGSGAGPWLASTSGETKGGISFELRIRRPNAGVRAVLIRTTAVDPVGNEGTLDFPVKLPR